jgi:hypothetical protein
MALGVDPEWYAAHKWGATAIPTDIFVIFLKFHPVCYLHLYFIGIALAVLPRPLLLILQP